MEIMTTGYFVPEWIAQSENPNFIQELLPYFVGNLDEIPITVGQMKNYANCSHPIINDTPTTGNPTVFFKLFVKVDGKLSPVLLTDWQVCGKPNRVEEVRYWSVFSPEQKAIGVLKWVIDTHIRELEEKKERIAVKESCEKQDYKARVLLEQVEAEALQERRQLPPQRYMAPWEYAS